jgi:hypothetical protein
MSICRVGLPFPTPILSLSDPFCNPFSNPLGFHSAQQPAEPNGNPFGTHSAHDPRSGEYPGLILSTFYDREIVRKIYPRPVDICKIYADPIVAIGI